VPILINFTRNNTLSDKHYFTTTIIATAKETKTKHLPSGIPTWPLHQCCHLSDKKPGWSLCHILYV